MGYLDEQSISIDAILTKKGRELLSRGKQYFNIVQFALADDEIDYRLWNPNHTLGSEYYGEIIENMPILEANANENQMMKYKIVTFAKNITRLPQLSVGITSLILQSGEKHAILPRITNFANANSQFGYTAIVSNSDVLTLTSTKPIPISDIKTTTYSDQFSEKQSVYKFGFEFSIQGRSLSQNKQATVTIIGNETGGREVINVTVLKEAARQQSGI